MSQEWKIDDELLKEMSETLRAAMGMVRVASLPLDAVECATKAVCALPGVDYVCAKAVTALGSVVPDGARQLVQHVTAEALRLPPLVERIFGIPQRETAQAMGDAVGLLVATLVSGTIREIRVARKASATALPPVPLGQHHVHVTSGSSEGVATYILCDPRGAKVAPVYLAEIKAWPSHAASLEARPKYGARTQTSGIFIESLRHLKEVARSNGCVDLHLSLDPWNPRFFAMLQRRLDYLGERLVTTNIIPSFSAPTFRVPVTFPTVPFAGSVVSGLLAGGVAASHSSLLPRPTSTTTPALPLSFPDRAPPDPVRGSGPSASPNPNPPDASSDPRRHTYRSDFSTTSSSSSSVTPTPLSRLSALSPSPYAASFLRPLASESKSTSALTHAFGLAAKQTERVASNGSGNDGNVQQYLESYALFQTARCWNRAGDGVSQFVAEVQSARRRDAEIARQREVESANARLTARIFTSGPSSMPPPPLPPLPPPLPSSSRAPTLKDRLPERPTRPFSVPTTAVVTKQTGSWDTTDAGTRGRLAMESDGTIFFTSPDTGEVSRVSDTPPPTVTATIRQLPPPPSVGDTNTSNGRTWQVTHVCRGPAGNLMSAIVRDVTPQNQCPFLPNYQPLSQYCIAAQPGKSGLDQYSHIVKANRWYLNTNGQVTQYEDVPGGGRHFHYGPFSAFPPEVIARLR